MIIKCRSLNKLEIIVLLVIMFSSFSASCLNIEKRTRKQAESLLGIMMPDEATDFQFMKVQKSDEFTRPYYVYISAEMSEKDYMNLVQQLELTLKQEKYQNEYTSLLLSPLSGDIYDPVWWNPPALSNDLSAAGEFQAAQDYGWIISTYHNGIGYFKLFEQ